MVRPMTQGAGGGSSTPKKVHSIRYTYILLLCFFVECCLLNTGVKLFSLTTTPHNNNVKEDSEFDIDSPVPSILQQQQQQQLDVSNNKIHEQQSTDTIQRKQGRDVIVYLGQFGNHSSYKNTDSLTKLNKSLELLYTNYVNEFPCDVIIFYGPKDELSDLVYTTLTENRPRLQFLQLNGEWWTLPHGLIQPKKDAKRKRWARPGFSLGYRHMMRWFAVLIWQYLDSLEYTHAMRMDDDSYIYSKIRYNLFDRMRENDKRYVFRLLTKDTQRGKGYDDLVDAYLDENNNVAKNDAVADYKSRRDVGFYNNWFMADISFFLTPPALTLLQLIDESNVIYTKRTGDLVIHSTLVRLFMPPEQVEWNEEFTYEHMSYCVEDQCKGCPRCGGLSRGSNSTDSEWNAVMGPFKDRFPQECSNSSNNPYGVVRVSNDFAGPAGNGLYRKENIGYPQSKGFSSYFSKIVGNIAAK